IHSVDIPEVYLFSERKKYDNLTPPQTPPVRRLSLRPISRHRLAVKPSLTATAPGSSPESIIALATSVFVLVSGTCVSNACLSAAFSSSRVVMRLANGATAASTTAFISVKVGRCWLARLLSNTNRSKQLSHTCSLLWWYRSRVHSGLPCLRK